jgi:hypothetical protein
MPGAGIVCSLSGFVRLLRRSSGSERKLALPDKHQVADVNDRVRQISENADGISPEKKIQKHHDATGDAPEPE